MSVSRSSGKTRQPSCASERSAALTAGLARARAVLASGNGYPSADAAGLGVAANLTEPDPFTLIPGGFPAPPWGLAVRVTDAPNPAACYFLYLAAPPGGTPTLSAAVTGGC